MKANPHLAVVALFTAALAFCHIASWATGIPWTAWVAGVALYTAVVALTKITAAEEQA